MANSNVTDNRSLAYKLSGWSCIILMGYTPATILVVILIGGAPKSVGERKWNNDSGRPTLSFAVPVNNSLSF